MSKAILVMDMPDRCGDCKLYFEDYRYTDHIEIHQVCTAGNDWEYTDHDADRPADCPLVEAIGYIQPVGHMVSWEDEE